MSVLISLPSINQGPAGSTGSTGATGATGSTGPQGNQGTRGATFKGHFSGTGGLPAYDGTTVINGDWATVGSTNELYQVVSGSWADQTTALQGPQGVPGPSSITSLTTGSAVVPTVGSSVSVATVAPWVDPGDTVSVNDGTHQMKGVVTANSGTAITVINTSFAGNSSPGATLANGSLLSLCNSDSCDEAYFCEDFILNVSAPGYIWSATGVSIVDLADSSHLGVWSFGFDGAVSFLPYAGGNSFTPITKAVIRAVLKADASPETGSHEWLMGFYMTDGGGHPFGAALSQAQGFSGLPQVGGGSVNATTGLLAGTYNGTTINYLQTGFLPAANQWVDLIVVWTPTASRFYGSVEGTPPALLATITTNLGPASKQYVPQISNNSNTTTLYVDRMEVLFQMGGNRYMGKRLIGL